MDSVRSREMADLISRYEKRRALEVPRTMQKMKESFNELEIWQMQQLLGELKSVAKFGKYYFDRPRADLNIRQAYLNAAHCISVLQEMDEGLKGDEFLRAKKVIQERILHVEAIQKLIQDELQLTDEEIVGFLGGPT